MAPLFSEGKVMELVDEAKEIGPNLFASVMGTGIIANAAVTLPIFGEELQPFALIVWLLATVLLVFLSVLKILQMVMRPDVVQRQLNDPVMAQFFGAPPMALLTISGGFILIGKTVIAPWLAIEIAWWLWVVGTVLGLATAVSIPYRLFTRYKVKDDAAFGGWLMPVVPPMVSAAVGALLIPYLGDAESKRLLMYLCYSLFGISFMAAFIIITMIWSRLAHAGTSGGARVPTLWIVLGPLGQSITAMGALGLVASQVVSAEKAALLDGMSSVFGVPVWGFAMFWFVLASLLTLKALKLKMPFSLTWWSFTFPVGTCVTGTTQLALHTNMMFFDIAAVVLFSLLILAWVIATIGTLKGIYQGHILRPATGAPDVISRKDH